MSYERSSNAAVIRHLIRSKALLLLFALIASLLIVGMVQDSINTLEKGCSKYDSAPMYWQYTCANGKQFYEQK